MRSAAAAAAAALLAAFCGFSAFHSSHSQVLEDVDAVIVRVIENYPQGLSAAQQESRDAGGHVPYTHPDLAFYMKSSIDGYNGGALRRPVTSFLSQGGERDFAVAVWSCTADTEDEAVYDMSCHTWQWPDTIQGDKCADIANSLIWKFCNLRNPVEGFLCFHLGIFWLPTYTYAALGHPYMHAQNEELRINIYTAIAKCRHGNPSYSRLPLEARTQRAFLNCLLPELILAHPLDKDGPLLLMPGRNSDGSFTANAGGMMVIDFSKEEGLPPGGHDWRLILSIRAERMPTVPTANKRYRLRPG